MERNFFTMKKTQLTRLLAVFLTALMILPVVGCATGDQTADTTAAADATGTEGETAYKPDIDVKNYDCDFNIVIGGTYSRDTFTIAGMTAPVLYDPFADAEIPCEFTADGDEFGFTVTLGALQSLIVKEK